MNKVVVARWSSLADRIPTAALVADLDLVVVRMDDSVSVLYGRCLHRGALLADGYVRGDDLICGLHHWDYRVESGVSAYNNKEVLPRFSAWVEDDRPNIARGATGFGVPTLVELAAPVEA